MAISMTEAAARHIRRSLDGRGKGEGIRLGVRTTGCSGLAYVLEFVDEVGEEDQVFETHGEKVIIDPKSLTYLDGTELDFVKEGLNEGFKFNNPIVHRNFQRQLATLQRQQITRARAISASAP